MTNQERLGWLVHELDHVHRAPESALALADELLRRDWMCELGAWLVQTHLSSPPTQAELELLLSFAARAEARRREIAAGMLQGEKFKRVIAGHEAELAAMTISERRAWLLARDAHPLYFDSADGNEASLDEPGSVPK